MLSAKVSTKHQISIPSEARKRLGIEPGDRLAVEVTDEALILRRRSAKPSERLRGLARGMYEGLDAVDYVRKMRDEWDE
jgi:AbrB family looped-hinge helix DNA binding protein